MKLLNLTAAVAALVLGTGAAMAGGMSSHESASGGANAQAPGTQLHTRGSVSGTTGASGYSPGHQMQTKGSAAGSVGASGYAPGHVKTDTGVKAGAKIR